MEAHGPVGLVMTQPRFVNTNPLGVFFPVFGTGYCFLFHPKYLHLFLQGLKGI